MNSTEGFLRILPQIGTSKDIKRNSCSLTSLSSPLFFFFFLLWPVVLPIVSYFCWRFQSFDPSKSPFKFLFWMSECPLEAIWPPFKAKQWHTVLRQTFLSNSKNQLICSVDDFPSCPKHRKKRLDKVEL